MKLSCSACHQEAQKGAQHDEPAGVMLLAFAHGRFLITHTTLHNGSGKAVFS